MKKKEKGKRALSSRGSAGAPRPTRTPSSLAFPLLRAFLLAAVGVVASAYGIWRYYTVKRPPMVVPLPATSPTEIPIEVE